MSLHELSGKIEQAFSLNEIDDLCFKLSINSDNLPGNTHNMKARELVLYCDRRGNIEELVNLCRKKRPNQNWIIIDPSRPNIFGLFPPQPLNFVGRIGDFKEIRQRLKRETETGTTVLTTIQGLPGVGKTALAKMLLYQRFVKNDFPDGVWFLRF